MDHTEHPGVPQRPPASALFNINSIDRYASSANPVAQYAPITTPPTSATGLIPYANNYNMSLGRPLLSGYFTRLGVTQVQLDWEIPTIVNNVNDALYMLNDTSGTSINITLTPGFYNGTTLAAMIQTRLIAGWATAGAPIPGLTVTYQSSTNSLTFSAGGAISFHFAIPTAYAQLGANPPSRWLKTFNSLGLSYRNTQTAPGQLTNSIKLIYTSYIDIISRKLTQYMRVKDSETSWNPDTAVLCRIYLTPPNQRLIADASGNGLGSQPFTLCVDPNTPKHIKWSPDQFVYDFDIQVNDEFGDLLPWSQAYPFEFQMTLLASET